MADKEPRNTTSRRSFLGRLFGLGAGAAVVAALPNMANAEAAPAVEASKESTNPEQAMLSFLEGNFRVSQLDPGFKLAPVTDLNGTRHIAKLTATDGTPVTVIYRTDPSGKELFKAVQIEEQGNEDANALLSDARMDDRYSRWFQLSDEAQQTPWTGSRNQHSPDKPPQKQRIIVNPDGTKTIYETIMLGTGPHRVLSQASSAAPESIPFQKGTAFIDAR